jgi:hypothetical protein
LQGEQGEKGEPGTNGTNGADGADGVDGATGPQGPKGELGPQGPQGDTGPTGSGNTIAQSKQSTPPIVYEVTNKKRGGTTNCELIIGSNVIAAGDLLAVALDPSDTNFDGSFVASGPDGTKAKYQCPPGGNNIDTASLGTVTVTKAQIETTSTTYTAISGGPSVTVTGAHTILVTLTVNCWNSDNDSGCFMGFDATGGLTQSASDSFAVGSGREPGPSPNRTISQSASYLVTTTGDTTFTASYRAVANTARFGASAIIVQVY